MAHFLTHILLLFSFSSMVYWTHASEGITDASSEKANENYISSETFEQRSANSQHNQEESTTPISTEKASTNGTKPFRVVPPFFPFISNFATLNCPAQCPPCPKCPACPVAPACPRPQPCPIKIPQGYKYYKNLGYYKIHTVPRNWFDAKATCEREGAHLVILNSNAEADLVSTLVNQRHMFVFIGFHDLLHSRVFLTVLDQPLSSTGYGMWAKGEPNNIKERCGTLIIGKGLNDEGCSKLLPFVCELVV